MVKYWFNAGISDAQLWLPLAVLRCRDEQPVGHNYGRVYGEW